MSDLVLTEEEKNLILKMRKKENIFSEIKDLIDSGILSFKELEEEIMKYKPKSNRGRKAK